MDYPITRASFNLTQACNLRCPFCFTYGRASGIMSIETAKKGVDFLFRNADLCKGVDRRVDISFWGGEPLLQWDLLKQIVFYAKDVSKETAIPVNFGGTTNGTLLTKDKFDFLDEHGIFFMVSFDGTIETHNMFRKFRNGEGSYAIVLQNLKDALKRWPNYKVRMSPTADRIDHFFEDIKYIFDLGCNYIMFSPVYESNYTDAHWSIFEEQCYKIIDYMKVLRDNGRHVDVEHFNKYTGPDKSRWPCGAGRFYAHINHEGYIYVCHRFEKFNNELPYEQQEYCIGHIDVGITKPEIRQRFIDFKPQCIEGNCYGTTPCWGGCYAVNYDFTKDITKPYEGCCKYVNSQKKVSKYYKEVLGDTQQSNLSCGCYMATYIDAERALAMNDKLNILAGLIRDLNQRLIKLEGKHGGSA